MPQYTKEQLLAKSVEELKNIATELNTPNSYSNVREQLVYDILDRQAEMTGEDLETAPKRKRIVQKQQNHVYSATQEGESERFDSPKEERQAKRMIAAKAREEEAAAVRALLDAGQVPELPKRKRGRPSKAEIEARKQFEEQVARQAALMSDTQGVLPFGGDEQSNNTEPTTTITEEPHGDNSIPDSMTKEGDLPDFIVEQMSQQAGDLSQETTATSELTDLSEHFRQRSNEAAPKVQSNDVQQNVQGVDDGEDFIIVDDIPVIDMNDYNFSDSGVYSQPDLTYTPAPAPVQKFHRFKDDVLLNPQLQHRMEGTGVSRQSTPKDVLIDACGVLELDPQGIGFLRSSDYNYMPSPDDIFVSQYQIRSLALKMGDVVECKVKAPKEGDKYFTLVSVDRINGLEPHQVRDRVAFEHLTPLFPDEQFKLSTGRNSPLSCRVVDLFSPIGKGQRALIVAQPKTGKTILMKQIANAIAANYPETYLMMLLIDERPEEVTDMARTVNAEVIASTFDEPASRHVRIAQMVLEKAKRMVECGHDVVIFLDSITRLARAFNTTAPASGKILTGGVDANALQKPKRFFGAARNIENGGSLTIIATALIDTGSKMDEVIFEEFKGTGNMELQLDRALSNKRIFPAVNLIQSSTRRDDLLLDETTLNRMYILRNYMGDMSSMEAMEFVKKRIEGTLSNEEFLATMNK